MQFVPVLLSEVSSAVGVTRRLFLSSVYLFAISRQFLHPPGRELQPAPSAGSTRDCPAPFARVRKAGAKLHPNGVTGTRDEVVPLLQHSPDSLSSDDPRRLVSTLAELRGDASTE